jgi:hypothetical protein
MEHSNTELDKTILGFSCIIPSFRYSIIPELSFQILATLTFILGLDFDIWIDQYV